MTLRLSDEQTEALRRKAAAEHRSMQQVALAANSADFRGLESAVTVVSVPAPGVRPLNR
jgi:hypothetical protein